MPHPLRRRRLLLDGSSVWASAQAYWRPDRYSGAGELFDLNGSGYHVQLGSTSGADTNDPTFVAGEGFVFSVDDFMSTAVPIISGAGPWSMAARVKVSDQAALTFARATTATENDVGGVVRTRAIDVLRDKHHALSTDGNTYRTTVTERAYTNKVATALASWTLNGATITSTTVADPAGGTGAIEITASAGGGVHQIANTPTTAIGGISGEVWFNAGTHGFARLECYNATDGTFLRVSVNLSTGAVVGTAMGAYKITVRSDGWVRIQVIGGAQTVANSDVYLRLVDSASSATWTAAGTETIKVWRPTLYEQKVPPPTPLGIGEARGADSLTVPLKNATPQQGNWYYEGLVGDLPNMGAIRWLFSVGAAAGTNASIRCYYNDASAAVTVAFSNGTANTTAFWNVTLALTDHIRIRIYQASNGALTPRLSVNGAAEVSPSGTTGGTIALPATWFSNDVALAGVISTIAFANAGLVTFKGKSGAELSMAQLAALTGAECDLAYYSVGMEANRAVMIAQRYGYTHPYAGLFLDSTEKLLYRSADNSATAVATTLGSTMTGGTWYTLAITHDGTTVRTYLDGVLQDSVAHSGTYSNIDRIVFGALVEAVTTVALQGETIKAAGVWTRALSQSEIQRLPAGVT